MTSVKEKGYQEYLDQLEKLLEKYLLQKAPSMPEAWKKLWIKILPFIIIFMLVITIPIVLAVFGLSFVILPISFIGGLGTGFTYLLAVALLSATIILNIMALPGLFKPSQKGWRLIYYSTLLGGVFNILTLNLGGLIIGTTLALYLLFQTRSYYQ